MNVDPVVVLPGGSAVLTPPAVQVLYRIAAAGVRSTERRDGITATAEVRQLLGALAQACDLAATAANGSAVGHGSESGETSTSIGSAEVAAMLGCKRRNVRDRAERGSLPGVKVGDVWTFDRDNIAAIAQQEQGRTDAVV